MSEIKITDILTTDPCKLYKYIESYRGYASNSGSPTDTLTVTFKDNVLFDDEKIKSGFLKVFVNRVYDTEGKFIDHDIYKKVAALEYEQNMYEFVRLLIILNYCPYFVKSLVMAKNCSLSDFGKIIRINSEISDRDAQLSAFRSFWYMLTNSKNRPAVDDVEDFYEIGDKSVNEAIQDVGIELVRKAKNVNNDILADLNERDVLIDILNNFDSSTVNFMLNENVENGVKLVKWKDFYKNSYSKKDSVTENQFLLMVFFQIAICLHGMNNLRMLHNDLHSENIYISEVGEEKIRYKIENNVYTFSNLGIKVQLFDFDFSYARIIGNNPLLEGKNNRFCTDERYRLCNKFVANKDMLKMFLGGWSISLYDYINTEQKTILSKIISNDIANVKHFVKREVSVKDKNTPFVTPSFEIIQRTTNTLNEMKVEVNVVEYDKKVEYDYHISKEKAEKIAKFYHRIFLLYIKKKISTETMKKILQLKKEFYLGTVKHEEAQKRKGEIFSTIAPKSEREQTLADFKSLVEGRKESMRTISEEELEEMLSQ